MLAPFSNYPVNEAFERLMAEERAARAARAGHHVPIVRMPGTVRPHHTASANTPR